MPTLNRQFLVCAVLILLLGAGLRFYDISATAVTTDEALTYQRTQGSLQDRLEHIAGPGNHVPLYFLSVGILPHETDLGLRYGGLMLGLVSIALVIRVVGSFYQNREMALWLGLWMACSPFMVFYARDARPYAMVFVLGLLASTLFLRLLTGHRSALIWGIFLLTSMATYITHFAAAALPFSQLLVLLWVQTRLRFIAQWIFTQVVASIPTFLWLLIYATPKGESNDWISIPNLGRPYYTLTNITLGYAGQPTWYFIVGLLFLTPGLVVGVYWMVKDSRENPIDAYWVVLSLFPILLVFVISQVRPLYVERYFMVTAYAIFIVIYRGWQHLNHRLPLRFSASIVVLVALGVTLNSLQTNEFEDQDWQSSTTYLLDYLQIDDGILLDGPHETAFWHYYRGHNPKLIVSNDQMEALYKGKLALCDLPYKRLWLMTGNSLSSAAKRIFEAEPLLMRKNYHGIGVRLIEIPECD